MCRISDPESLIAETTCPYRFSLGKLFFSKNILNIDFSNKESLLLSIIKE